MRLYAKRDRPDSSTPLFAWATHAEIMAEHPVCAQCKHWTNASDGAIRCFSEQSRLRFERTEATDYCNKWKAKP
jgi:hypothetical protein